MMPSFIFRNGKFQGTVSKTIRNALSQVSKNKEATVSICNQNAFKTSRRHESIFASLKTPVYDTPNFEDSINDSESDFITLFNKRLGPGPSVTTNNSDTIERSASSSQVSSTNPYDGITLDKSIFESGAQKTQQQQAQQIKSQSLGLNSTRFTKLPNGLRIVSSDKGGLAASMGLFVQLGSRFELPEERGCSHLLEMMSFRSTKNFSNYAMAKTFEKLAAQVHTAVGRENILYKVDVLRDSIPFVLPLLLDNLLNPSFLQEEIEEALHKIRDTKVLLEQNGPENLVSELTHQVAFGGESGIGASIMGEDLEQMRENVVNYHRKFVKTGLESESSDASNMLICAINVDHDELVKLVYEAFKMLSNSESASESQQVTETKDNDSKSESATSSTSNSSESPNLASILSNSPAPQYIGGFLSQPSSLPKEISPPLAHIVVAFQIEDGWNSKDLLCVTVLQSLLGGGGSFSTGGPGKGMHSRLFTNVLNRYYWVESCMAFSHVYSDCGLFGLYGTVAPEQARNFVTIVANQFIDMRVFTDEEVQRAKNGLKSSIYMNLETNSIALEDVGRQLLMCGKVATGKEFGKLIDQVQPEDLVRVARKLLNSGKPTVIHYGNIVETLNYDEICRTMEQVKSVFGNDYGR